LGLGQTELARFTKRTAVIVADPDLERETSRLSGSEGLTERHNTFARRHALAELAGAFDQGATIQELEAATNSYLADKSVAELTLGGDGESRYTTHDLLALERELVEGASRRATNGIGILAENDINSALAG
jgi:hypothetical protein